MVLNLLPKLSFSKIKVELFLSSLSFYLYAVCYNHVNVISVKGDTVVRTTPSKIDDQIEQATPIIGKQSSIATSVMKRRQKNLDSNDTQGEIMNDDLSKTEKHPSVGQTEGFDSEANGMTDQAFSKTENLSHGKKVVS